MSDVATRRRRDQITEVKGALTRFELIERRRRELLALA
jgi:hypothetical protein